MSLTGVVSSNQYTMHSFRRGGARFTLNPVFRVTLYSYLVTGNQIVILGI